MPFFSTAQQCLRGHRQHKGDDDDDDDDQGRGQHANVINDAASTHATAHLYADAKTTKRMNLRRIMGK